MEKREKRRPDKRALTATGFAALLVLMVLAEVLFHTQERAAIHQVFIHDLLFPMRTVFTEDRAMIVLRCALMVPVGALLWRLCKHPLRWAGGVLGAVTLVELLQFALRVYYFRLYAILVCAAGLMLGAVFHSICLRVQNNKGMQWGFLCVCAAIAIGAEYIQSSGRNLYEILAEGVPVYRCILVLAVLLGKAVCLNMAASGLLKPWLAAALCTAILCAGWPSAFWQTFAIGGVHVFYPLVYALCAVGASMLLSRVVLGKE